MSKFEDTMIELDTLNKNLLFKKRGGTAITQDEYAQVKELVKTIHTESAGVEIPEIGRLLDLYDLGLGVRYIEPSYTRLNEAFAWLESQGDEAGTDAAEDF